MAAFSGFSAFAQMAQMLFVLPGISRLQLVRWSNIRLHAASTSGDESSSMRTVKPCWTHRELSSSEHVELRPQLRSHAVLESQLYEADEHASRQLEHADESRDVFSSHAVLVHVFAIAGWAPLEDDEQAARGSMTKATERAVAADTKVRMTPRRPHRGKVACFLHALFASVDQRSALRVWPSPGFQPPLS
jgi:hypothetical protein